MALLFIDGAGHYGTDEIGKKYTEVDETNGTWTVVPEGRFRNALKKTVTVPGTLTTRCGYVEYSPLMTQSGPWKQTDSGVVGFALRVNNLDYIIDTYQGDSHTQNIFQILEGSAPILNITLNSTGTFGVYYQNEVAFGIQSVYVGSSIQGIRSNIWSYVEIKWLIHDSAGRVTIRVNGVEVFDYTGRTSGSSVSHSYTDVWNTVRWGRVPGTTDLRLWLGDIYLADLTGEGDAIRDFLGDVTVDYIVPEGVGNSSGWTPLSGANWSNVKEVPPDEDTTYVSTTAPGTRDTYVMQDVPEGTVPIGFQTLIYARKETEGGASLRPVYREDSTDYAGPTQGIATPDEYRYLIQPYDTNPATGATITEEEINAAEFGFEKVI